MGLVRGMLCGLCVYCLQAIIAVSAARAESSITMLSELPGNVADYRVVDLRGEVDCTTASLPGARCLPLEYFIRSEGEVIDFHALRWLLGAVGLRGDELVLVVGSDARGSRGVASLLHSVGQYHVAVYVGPFNPSADAKPGEARSFSRETVYTAPMRID